MPPAKPEMDGLDTMTRFGRVESYLEDQRILLIVLDVGNEGTVYDLDNIIVSENRLVLGYINDVIGPVTNPLYSVHLFPDPPAITLLHATVYVLDKTLKIVNQDSLMIQKGTDASN